MIIWLIGLSGAGKTTIGRMVYRELKKRDPAVVLLDGDILRDVWGDTLGHDIEGRRVNAHRISHLCRMLDRQGITVVAAVLSIFPEWQQWNRDNFSRYVEIFLDAPLNVLVERDEKSLYKPALEGSIPNVVGVDIDFPVPPNADLRIDTSGESGGPERAVETILDYLQCP